MRIPNELWVNKGSEYNSYNSFFKKWLKNNDIKIDSTHNEGKSVAAERFIRTFWIKLVSIWLQYQ